MKGALTGKTVLVTGAAMGIGRAIAEAAADAGAAVTIGDVAAEALSRTAADLVERGAAVASRLCDVRRQQDLDELVALCADEFGVPDIVYANAGIIDGKLGSPADYSEEEFTRVIDINLNGVWRTFKAALPGMLSRGSGSIVATASVAGLVGAGGLPAYVASKHGIVGLVRSTAITLARTGVRVNALCPGMADTAMLKGLIASDPAVEQGLLTFTPMGRVAAVEEIAAAAIWLGSDQASFVTGHALAIDGGYAAQ